MAAGKWIGSFLGWMAGGPLGALAGLVIGAMFDYGMDSVNTPDTGGSATGCSPDGSWRGVEGERNSFVFGR